VTRRLFLSDVHLVACDHRFAAFERLLDEQAMRVDEIYLLGDICEIWIGDDDDTPMVQSLANCCARNAQHAALYFMPGNRDFLLGENFAKRACLTRLPDPFQLPDGTMLTHGDALCTDDEAYQALRKVLRSPAWQDDMLTKSLVERRAFGQALRERSVAANENKATNIMDVNAAATETLLVDNHSKLLIHGHTHRPGVHQLGDERCRIVLGAWERCAWWLEQDTGAIADCRLRSQSISYLARSQP